MIRKSEDQKMEVMPQRGVLLIDKPAGMTSHDVVARVRRVFGLRRVGHAGTLDPEATGLLIVAIGNITRLIDLYQEKPKSYVGEVVFGTETDSYDSTGKVVAHYDMPALTEELLASVADRFRGDILQYPPIVSALKVQGKRLYQYHRDSEDVVIKARKVHISSFEYQLIDSATIQISVVCSPGTYIRSIAHDLGVALGGGAYLRNLRRVSSGDFSVEQAVSLENIQPSTVLAPKDAFRGIDTIGISGEQLAKVRNGMKVEFESGLGGEVIVFDKTMGALTMWEQVVGLYKRESGQIYKAGVILPPIN